MKIEKLILENINSLCGHFEIDFCEPSLCDSGIFVITGPTGVGKTSLMDAVCFALYGQTPRLKKISAANNELMTRGAPSCMAEVILEQDGKRYRIRNEQKRSRLNSQKPFGVPSRRFSIIQADGTEKLLAEKSTDVDKLVQQSCRLDFKNFQHCIMLAQGSFAAFLKADTGDRGDILEKITGTGIYQRIGEKLQDHIRDLTEKQEALHALQTLPDEEREKLEAEAQSLNQKQQELQGQIQSVEAELRWLEEYSLLQQDLQKAAEALTKSRAEFSAFKESGKEALLQEMENARSMLPKFTLLQERRKNSDAAQEKLAAAEAEIRELLPADAPLPDEAWLEARQSLIHQIRPLEEQIRQTDALLQNRNTEAAQAEGERMSSLKALTSNQEAQQRNQEEIRHVQEQMETLQSHQALPEQLPALEQSFKAWAGNPDSEEEIPPTAELEEKLRSAEEERQKREEEQSEEDCQSRILNLQHLIDRSMAAEDAEKKLLLAQENLRKEEEAQQQLPPLQEAIKKEEACAQHYQLLKDTADVEEQLKQFYIEFRDGKRSCCPCCGSTDCPGERHVEASPLSESAKRAEEAKEARIQLEKQHNKAAAQRVACAAEEKQAQSAMEEAKKRIRQSLEALQLEQMPEDVEKELQNVQAHLQALQSLSKLLPKLRNWLHAARQREEFHAHIRPQIGGNALPMRPSEAKPLMQELRQICEKLGKLRSEETSKNQTLGKLKSQEEVLKLNADSCETNAKAKQAALQTAKEAQAELRQRRDAMPEKRSADLLEQELNRIRLAKQKRDNALHGKEEAAQGLVLTQQDFDKALHENGFLSQEPFMAVLEKFPLRDALLKQQEEICRVLTRNEQTYQLKKHETEKKKNEPHSELEKEALESGLKQKQSTLAEVNEKQTALSGRLQADDLARDKNRGIEQQRRELEQEKGNWETLKEIMGGTKDSFQRYAQSITFELLIAHANHQLSRLNERYSLMQGSELQLRVHDCYLEEEEGRDCANLSGGETFLVSLSLALGLAQMTGENRFDTLFLDEGFGTLDNATLDQVLQCLQSLNMEGKLIGIISHVEKLKEQIPCNIELQGRSIKGLSTIAAHPAVLARPTKAESSTAADAKEAQSEKLLSLLAGRPGQLEKELRQQLPACNNFRKLLQELCAKGRIRLELRGARKYYHLNNHAAEKGGDNSPVET